MPHSPHLSPEEQRKQELYRDARSTGQYHNIWQSVGKCVFCDLKEKYVFFEENGIVMTINIHAYIDGHFMILPRRHVRSTKDLTQREWETMRKFSYIAKKIIKDVHGIRGMQLVFKDGAEAQSTVTDHLHFHCIPFDAPDLCQWNYRQLKYTPLENVELYKQAGKKITSYDERFARKYEHQSKLGVVVDLILINNRSEILFQERPDWAKVGNGWITTPGGSVDNFDVTLEQELAREVREETGLMLDPNHFELVTSRIENLQRHRQVKTLGLAYDYTDRFLWNTYVLKGHDPAAPMQAADDAQHLIWVPLVEVQNHPNISPGMKAAIRSLKP
jgi:diadenosine tetraphosphate (Ap4A) HIT family hydrolase/8-oxo-dGTP pyrophosphatase MutT (NUDIX family)